MSWFRRRLMMQEVSSAPYDYEIEYIASDGNQWLKMDILPDENTDAVEFGFAQDVNKTQARFCCCRSDEGSTNTIFNLYINGSSTLAYNFGNAWKSISGSNYNNGTVPNLAYHEWKADYKNKQNTVDGVTGAFASGTARISDYNLYILRAHATNQPYVGRLYYLKYWRNDVLIRDMIPVSKGGKGMMYDKVTQKVYKNDGTGNFTCGGKLEPVTFNNPYITNGLVAMYDGIANTRFFTHDNNAKYWKDVAGNNNMKIQSVSWDTNSFVFTQTQIKTLISSVNYITLEIVAKVDWTTNTTYNEAVILSQMYGGLGFFAMFTESGQLYFNSGDSGQTYKGRKYCDGLPMTFGNKFTATYIVGSATSQVSTGWECYFNNTSYPMSASTSTIGTSSYGSGLNRRSDRRFQGNIYCIRMYNRALTAQEIAANHAVDVQRFNLT